MRNIFHSVSSDLVGRVIISYNQSESTKHTKQLIYIQAIQ